jgi:anti-sigma regulatory factor (Ser/Thr protein kinase)
MNATFHQVITNDLENLHGLMDGASEFLESQEVDARSVFRINLVLEEIVTNIMKYGYDVPGRHQIEVALKVSAEEIFVVISDDGREFNPILHEKQTPAAELLERQTGGLGIHLIKKLLDSMEYYREGGRNIVQVKTKRNPVAPA